jgi:hypothetical protein
VSTFLEYSTGWAFFRYTSLVKKPIHNVVEGFTRFLLFRVQFLPRVAFDLDGRSFAYTHTDDDKQLQLIVILSNIPLWPTVPAVLVGHVKHDVSNKPALATRNEPVQVTPFGRGACRCQIPTSARGVAHHAGVVGPPHSTPPETCVGNEEAAHAEWGEAYIAQVGNSAGPPLLT